MIYKLDLNNNIDVLDISNSKEFISYICNCYHINQTELIAAYNKKYNTRITQPSFNRAINNNNLKLDTILNIIKLLDCNLLIKHNHKPII